MQHRGEGGVLRVLLPTKQPWTFVCTHDLTWLPHWWRTYTHASCIMYHLGRVSAKEWRMQMHVVHIPPILCVLCFWWWFAFLLCHKKQDNGNSSTSQLINNLNRRHHIFKSYLSCVISGWTYKGAASVACASYVHTHRHVFSADFIRLMSRRVCHRVCHRVCRHVLDLPQFSFFQLFVICAW